jgi:hypothetical protein
MGPYGNFDRVGMDGKTYYYFNPRQNQPGDAWYRTEAIRERHEEVTNNPSASGGFFGGEVPVKKLNTATTDPEIKNLLTNIEKLAFDPRIPAAGGGVPAKILKNIQPLVKELIEKLK